MPARQSTGGGGRSPKAGGASSRGKEPRAVPKAVPAKRLSGAKVSNKGYGPGAVSVYSQPAARAATKSAVRRTNRQVGQKVFKTVRAVKRADIKVRIAKPGSREQKSGRASGSPGYGDRGRVTVPRSALRQGSRMARTYNLTVTKKEVKGWNRTEASRTIQHELGHAVGLAHPGPSDDEYLRRRRRPKRTGIMGVGPKLSLPEVKAIKTLRRPTVKRSGTKKR